MVGKTAFYVQVLNEINKRRIEIIEVNLVKVD